MSISAITVADVPVYRQRLLNEMVAAGFPAGFVPGEGAIETTLNETTDFLWMNTGQENFTDANRVILWVSREGNQLFVRYAFGPTGPLRTVGNLTFGTFHAGLLRKLCELLVAAGLGNLSTSYARYASNPPPIVAIADVLATVANERTAKIAKTTPSKALARLTAAGIATLP